ncbi:hypothetical protein [Methylobacterium sp. Leaf93]|uniref:hypothetical protein n=1 Tax=Methylobacterium sp. Leaf93 TaxID=1736249 RepID=UPI0006F6A371|nr:hypothetical protein [Methylobacterium sp. Leaf93]KQP08295.1 hypothetical protein ASF26_21500 [Methylobacterium sp. Leaf93]
MNPDRGFEYLFPVQDVRHDFMEAQFSARVRGTAADLETVLRRLGGRGDRGVFRLRKKTGSLWHIDTRPDSALFSAQGTIRVPQGGGLLELEMRVQLNPTRFLAHQADPTPGAIHLRPPRDALKPDPAVEARLAARSLDGGDNYLTMPAQVPGFSERDAWWWGILRSYLGKIRQFVVDHLVSSFSRAKLERAGFGPIRKAEVQFEFYHPDAITWAGEFRNALCVADDAAESRSWGKKRRGAEGKRNTVGAYLDINKDTRLKVYAKDAHRIRIEVVFSKAQRISQVLTRSGLSPSDEIVSRVQSLRGEAVKQLAKVWKTVMQVTKACEATADICDFMARLNRQVPDENQRTMLSLLGNHRRVTATVPAGIAPDTVCRALVREGVLVPAGIVTRGPARYALAPTWSRMFDRLFGRNDAVTTLH